MSDLEKAMKDAALYGAGFMKDGKHIAPHDVRGEKVDEVEERLAVDPPKEFTGLAGVVKWAEDEAKADEPLTATAILRSHTFIHEIGSPARWEQVADMVYRDRHRLMALSYMRPTSVMINREERRHCIAWLRSNDPMRTGYFQSCMAMPEPGGGDDLLFNMPVFWAAPSSMGGQTVRVLTDFTQRS